METQEPNKFNQNPLDQQFGQQFGQPPGQQALPNAVGVLVLGILSIVFSLFFFCYFIPTIISMALAIVALALAPGTSKKYNEAPHLYTLGSYNNYKAGKICAIIGLVISSIIILLFIFALVFYASLFDNLFNRY